MRYGYIISVFERFLKSPNSLLCVLPRSSPDNIAMVTFCHLNFQNIRMKPLQLFVFFLLRAEIDFLDNSSFFVIVVTCTTIWNRRNRRRHIDYRIKNGPKGLICALSHDSNEPGGSRKKLVTFIYQGPRSTP